jgi:peptidoglycan/LPS O-acetylase OafA/YrhL
MTKGGEFGRHIPALTGLRFVLAIWVIVHHLTDKRMMLNDWASSTPPAARALLHGGYLAVETFFVLSGFVLTLTYGSTAWDQKKLIRYAAGRFARLYPNYLLGLLIVSPFIADYLLAGPALSEKAAQLTIYGLALQGWTTPAVYWNTPAWSLSCELFFYLCFPLVALSLRNRSPIKTLTVLAGAISLPMLLARMGAPATWKPVHHLADFLLGIAAAGVYEALAKSNIRPARNGWWFYGPAAALGLIVVSYGDLVSRSMDLNTALRPLNGALIVGLALGGGLPATLLSTPVATYLGRASYSMYILHIPMLWWYKRFWWYSRLTQTLAAVVYLLAVVLLSAVVLRLVEEPANRRLRSILAG